MYLSKRLFLWSLLFCFYSGRVQAVSYTWTASPSADWFDTNDWTPKAIPGPADTALISSGTATVGSATNVGTISLSGGTLNGAGSLVVSNAFNWTGGSFGGKLTIAAAATMNITGTG